jgi:hypothetical protein
LNHSICPYFVNVKCGSLTKAEASKRIDELQEVTGRGKKDEEGSNGTLTRLPCSRCRAGRG